MIVIRPDNISPREWCDRTSGNMAKFVNVVRVTSDIEWRRWGAHALAVLRRQGVMIPDPYAAQDFTTWASRFNQLVQDL